MPDGTLSVRGTQIAFSDEGAGPLIIRAHGLVHSRETDQKLGLIDWQGLSLVGFRVVSYDARGHGASAGTAEPGTYRWDSLAEDLLALIDHFSPDGPVRAIGISMGTGTILTAATLAPERFAAITLGAPPTAWQTRAAQGAMYEQFARTAESTPQDQFAAMLAQAPVPPIFAEQPGYPGTPAVAHALLPAILRGAGSSDLPAADLLTTVGVPSLILAWDTDPAHPVSTAQMLSEFLPDSTLHISQTAADVATWAARVATFFETAAHRSRQDFGRRQLGR